MIPKVIHYCWFGKNPKNDIIQKCISSWREYCPEYEIIEWNEDNFDVNMIQYTRDAYESKKYAYLSDFARLWIIYNHGGIYLDIDVLLHKSLDELCKYECWLACEEILYINTGLGFGAIKSHALIGKMLNAYYSETSFATCTTIDTPIVENELKSWTKSFDSQLIDEIYIIGANEYGKFARHLYTGMGTATTSKEETERLEKIRERLERSSTKKERLVYKFKLWVRNPKLVNLCAKRKNSILSKLYFFFAYDLIEFGPKHYFKKLFNKSFK